jgi:hypothetical protein
MTTKCIGDCQLFQIDLDRLGEWCCSIRFVLTAGKCKSISFHRNGTALERFDEIKDLGVIMNGRMSFLINIVTGSVFVAKWVTIYVPSRCRENILVIGVSNNLIL